MKSNFGDKLQAVALIIGMLEVLSTFFGGIYLISQGSGYHGNESLLLIGWFVLIGGTIISIVSSMIMYGFGVLIEKTQKIRELLMQEQKAILPVKPIKQDAHTEVRETRRTWICPSCGYKNDLSSLYCLNCKKRS